MVQSCNTMSSIDRPLFEKTELHSPEKERHNRIVFYTGTSCSGKDYLLDRVMNNLDKDELARLSMGTFISRRLAVERDKLRSQPGLQEIEKMKLEIAPEIIAMQPAVLVTHIVPKYDHVITLNPDFELAVNPAHFVVVVTKPEHVNLWRDERNKGGARFAPIEDPAILNLHQNMIVHNTFLIAQAIGSGFSVVINDPEVSATNKNVEFLQEVLKSI